LLGAAYEYLIGEFADSAGKKGGEFYTPRDVVRLMVQILKPQERMRIYDPCVGSGGMLLLSRQYVEEHGGDPRNLALQGQDSNGTTWAICKMNMILHGVPDADIQNEDVLTHPQHKEGGELLRFDRVISNPPFSQNYDRTDLEFPERFRYGFAPETGKKADLMFAQHMLASLRTSGMMATVMPHGVLFRGGAEKEIRKGFIESDALEAVIGLAPNLFYGTGIPACILVMRPPGEKPRERKGKVLFINADREFHAGRAQNFLRPEHVEKIVSVFDDFEDVPGFAKIVTRDKLAEEDFNCNIRRYAENAPPPEPQDVCAHLLGGIPKAEVQDKKALFDAHGFDPTSVFVERDAYYYDFAPTLTDRAAIRAAVEENYGVQDKEAQMSLAFATWWEAHEPRLAALPETRDLMDVRADLLASFAGALVPIGVLDRFKVDGVIARWWNETQYDLKTLATLSFDGLVQGWAATVRAGLDDSEDKTSGDRFDPLSHKLIPRLLPDYLRELEEAAAKLAETQGRLDAASQLSDDEHEEGDTPENLLGEADLPALKKDVTAAKKNLKTLRSGFLERLEEATAALSENDSRRLALGIAREDLQAQLERYVAAHRREIVAALENWWDKYRVSIREIEVGRVASAEALERFIGELGYAS
jgi:type I restriction enzyme M protein